MVVVTVVDFEDERTEEDIYPLVPSERVTAYQPFEHLPVMVTAVFLEMVVIFE